MDEKQFAAELRKKYLATPPEGMTVNDIENITDDDLLDMEYFLHEFDDDDEDDIDSEGFYIF